MAFVIHFIPKDGDNCAIFECHERQKFILRNSRPRKHTTNGYSDSQMVAREKRNNNLGRAALLLSPKCLERISAELSACPA